MRVGTARAIAANWVARHARDDAAYRGSSPRPRCHTILAADDAERHEALRPALRDALAGIPGRADRTPRYLPELWRTAETITAAGDAGGAPRPSPR